MSSVPLPTTVLIVPAPKPAAAIATASARRLMRERQFYTGRGGPGTKADEIALALEEAIVSGELAPGSVLRQEQVSAQYAVSRTPVREALRRLAALGLVSFEANRGFRVRTLSRSEMWEAFLLRAELESLVTGVAAERITEEDLDELEQAEQRFSRLTRALRAREPGDDRRSLTVEWMQANHGFHDVIYRVADLPYIEQVAKSARRTFSGPAVWAPGDESIDELYLANERQHVAIRAALAARQPRRAPARWRASTCSPRSACSRRSSSRSGRALHRRSPPAAAALREPRATRAPLRGLGRAASSARAALHGLRRAAAGPARSGSCSSSARRAPGRRSSPARSARCPASST